MTDGKFLIPFLLAVAGTFLLRFLPLNLDWSSALLIAGGFLLAHIITLFLSRLRFFNRNIRSDALPAFQGEMRITASLQEAVVIVNDSLQIEHMNAAARTLFPNALTGTFLSKLGRSEELIKTAQTALSGQTPQPFIFPIHDMVERHFRVTGSTLRAGNEDKGESRAIIVFYDVTDIERANALRADFLANASHELKTPVASLLGYIETLNGHAKDDPEARDKFLGIMQQQARRMQRLISDILSLRRIELSEHKAPTETADLYLAFIAAKESVAPMAEQKSIIIKYNGPKEMLVTGTQDELVQLTLNILDNAVKMSTDNSTVKITGETINSWQAERAFPTESLAEKSARRRIVNPPQTGIAYTQLRIRDTGPGFSHDHLPRLSERFYRVAGDRSSKEKGTGLGLAIVKHITMRHRGGLMIETAKKIGTEFTILIPSAAGPLDPEQAPKKAENQIFLNFKNLS